MSNRDLEIANQYHTSTKLVYLPLQDKPLAYKLYPTVPLRELPTEVAALNVPTLEALASGVSTDDLTYPLDLTQLATLLFYMAGRIRKRDFTGAGEVTFRAAASAGGLYPIELYAVCGKLPDLEAGVYHFSPVDFALRGLRQGDFRLVLSEAAGNDPTVANAPVTLICSAVFWRSAWKYRARSYRYCFWDNGTMTANLLAVAAATAIPARVLMGFVDDRVNALIDIDGQREASLSLVSLGHAIPVSPQTPQASDLDVAPLDIVTEQDPDEEIDYQELTELHRASALISSEEVSRWRGALVRPPGPQIESPVPLDPIAPDSGQLGTVIRQRGSTRRFAHEPISYRDLSAILVHATARISADFLDQANSSLLDLYLIVNAVEGLDSGGYLFSPKNQALECLRPGAFRQEAGHLCFEQALGADASVVVFFLADLNAVLHRFGNRGYRASQLQAGMIGGKLYLGAYALGLGASGLTFLDDEVTAFFSPHAAGKSVIFVVALGHTASENRVRPFRSRLGMMIDALSRRDAIE